MTDALILVKYYYHPNAEEAFPIFLDSNRNSFEDLKKIIIQSYFWNCEGKNCAKKNDCSCLPEVHNIRLQWSIRHDGRVIRHVCAPSHIATTSHPKLGIQEDIFVSDNMRLGLFLKEYVVVDFDVVPN